MRNQTMPAAPRDAGAAGTGAPASRGGACAVLERPAGREVVLTGRDPAPWMCEAADYHTQMRCVRHPYDAGVGARKGIEY